ncbi:MAG: hypothetical protein ACM3NH_00315 [Candidatus Saccharibacteria bacterium]
MDSDWIAVSLALLPKRTLTKMIDDVSSSVRRVAKIPLRPGRRGGAHQEEDSPTLADICFRLTANAVQRKEFWAAFVNRVPPLSASIRERVGEDVFKSLATVYR